MTLVASAPTISIDNLTDSLRSVEEAVSEEDSQSETSYHDITSLQRTADQPLDYSDALVQCLGYPGSDVVPHIGKVSIENSNGVHFGDKNIYQGPVTIKQIVYANGSAALESNNEKVKHNLGFEGDSEDFKASESKNSSRDPEVPVSGSQEPEYERLGFRKGFIWLQNVSKHRPVEIGMFVGVVVLFLIILVVVLCLRHPSGKNPKISHSNSEPDIVKPIGYDPDITATSQIQNKLRMISRFEWVAQPPINDTLPLVTPVPYVIIHHTATNNCSSQSQCVFHVRQIQTFHIESKGWYDIGYNFLVGGDGAAYEGRGWTVEGAHTFGWNSKSIGIAFVGTFISRAPQDIQIIACQKLIAQGVELGYIKKDYKILGARQLFGTESPGAALFEKMKTWPRWAKEP